jgi:hypothetical protein
MTPLHSTLKRAVDINGREYVLTLTPDHLRLTLKGKRNGVDLAWADLVNGEAALAIALRASVGAIKLDSEDTSRQGAPKLAGNPVARGAAPEKKHRKSRAARRKPARKVRSER